MTTPVFILLLLFSPLGIGFAFSRFTTQSSDIRKYACWGLGITFLFFFVGHFLKTEVMVEMLPTWVPYRFKVVYISGLLELLIGIALFIPKYQRPAAIAAIIVFVIFFPANIYAAINGVGPGGHQWGPVYLLIRMPLQVILILWAYFLCVKGTAKLSDPDSLD